MLKDNNVIGEHLKVLLNSIRIDAEEHVCESDVLGSLEKNTSLTKGDVGEKRASSLHTKKANRCKFDEISDAMLASAMVFIA